MKIIHIGLGKAGSTTLQQEIFPRICKRYNLNYINLEEYIDDNDIEYNVLEKQRNIEKMRNLEKLRKTCVFSWIFNDCLVSGSSKIIKNHKKC